MVSEPVMTKSPYNDSLYKRYCDLYETNNLVIDWQIMTWFIFTSMIITSLGFQKFINGRSIKRMVKIFIGFMSLASGGTFIKLKRLGSMMT